MHPTARTHPAAAIFATAFLGCLLTAMAACATSGTAGDDVPDPTGSGDSRQYGQAELDAAATKIDAYLRQGFPGHYAGIVLDPARPALIIYRRTSTALDAALRKWFGDVPVELRDAPYAARELEVLAKRIRGDAEDWRRQGLSITSVAVRPDGTAVEVGTHEVARATAELPKKYGQAPLVIIEAGPALPTPSR
ncbi:hypothetical protein [Streptosporangium sp. NPDC000396]|uniref:hypothetical protein n=1 Tax=Streptosporangium sp. NPDC000396 TaxID=3366185 RepID=UPI00367AD000